MKKRIFALGTAVALLLTLAACGGAPETSDTTPEPSAETTASPSPTPTPTPTPTPSPTPEPVDLGSYIGSYKNQEFDTQGLDVSMEGDNLRMVAYQPNIVFFDEVVSVQSLQGDQLHFVAEDPATQEHFNVTLTFDGAHIRVTSTSPQLGEEGVYIPGEASVLPVIEEPEDDPPEESEPQDVPLFSLSDYTGEYSYEDPAGDYYVLTLSDAVGGIQLTLLWRGMYLHENAYVADEDAEATGDGSYTFTFEDGGEPHWLVVWPSSDGGQQFYLDDVGPFVGNW